MATDKEQDDFEQGNKVRYYTDDERREKGLDSSHMLVGQGICPHCQNEVQVANDAGVLGGMTKGWRGSCYFANHYADKEAQHLCRGSEEVFSLMADEFYQHERA